MGEKKMDLSGGMLYIENDDGSVSPFCKVVDISIDGEYFEPVDFKTIKTAGEWSGTVELNRKSRRYLRKLSRAAKMQNKALNSFLRRRRRRALFRKWLNMLGICNCQKDGKNAYFFIDEMHEYRR